MTIGIAASVLAGLIFIAIIGAAVLYKNGKTIIFEIVDRED